MLLDDYLARIGLTGPVTPDAEGLDRLHIAHAAAIPFENMDIQADPPRPVRVDSAGVVAKLVGQRRGGYCFEQNTLLRLALEATGFRVRRALARVMWGTGEPGARTHLVNLVEASGDIWIADTGFGGQGLISPLRLAAGEQEVHGERFRLVPSALGRGVQLDTLLPDGWRPMYCLDPDEAVLDADIVTANHFTQSYPDSRFVVNRVAARNTPGIRRSLLNGEMKIRRGEVVETHLLATEAEFRDALADIFALRLPADHRLRPHPEIAA